MSIKRDLRPNPPFPGLDDGGVDLPGLNPIVSNIDTASSRSPGRVGWNNTKLTRAPGISINETLPLSAQP
jgi:hypothetical protein